MRGALASASNALLLSFNSTTTKEAKAKAKAKAKDIVSPGHIFPVKALPGGVLSRAGHTEGSTDLCRLAGLTESAVICEVMNEDGTMARYNDLIPFAKKHRLKIT